MSGFVLIEPGELTANAYFDTPANGPKIISLARDSFNANLRIQLMQENTRPYRTRFNGEIARAFNRHLE